MGPFVVAQLCIKQKGVLPLKGRLHGLNPLNVLGDIFYRDEKCFHGDVP
jgi:hypothetical protein